MATYAQQQAENLLKYYQGMSGTMREPSALASAEEREAFAAQEARAGRAPMETLPEEYGGRPTGGTRRALRQQWEWDQARKQQLAEEQAARQIEEFNLNVAREQRFRDQEDRELTKLKMLNDRENQIQQEARAIQDAIIGGQLVGTDEKGNPKFSEPINVRDPDAVERLQRLAKNRLGMENKAAYDMWKTLYDDALKYREEAERDMAETADKNLSFIVKQQEEASSLGVDTSKFFVQDKTTGEVKNVDQIGLAKAIGEARRADIENKKKEVAASKIDEETKKQASSIISQIEDTDKLIREANFKAQRETSKSNIDEYLSQAEFLRSERALLEQRFANLVPQAAQEQPQQPEAAQPKELSERDQAALNWANANPDDPRSQRIKAKLGVQ